MRFESCDLGLPRDDFHDLVVTGHYEVTRPPQKRDLAATELVEPRRVIDNEETAFLWKLLDDFDRALLCRAPKRLHAAEVHRPRPLALLLDEHEMQASPIKP